jgi:hypothetical protein
VTIEVVGGGGSGSAGGHQAVGGPEGRGTGGRDHRRRKRRTPPREGVTHSKWVYVINVPKDLNLNKDRKKSYLH